jgi:putative acetyltransferase
MTFLEITIRDETPADKDAITAVTAAAFASMEISSHTEQFIVQALRKAGALTISLVAVVDGRLVGHIAFSPITISDGTPGWYGLGPVSVLPELQKMGVGSALMHAGLDRLKAIGARGCCLVGHPTYYIKFGFANTDSLSHEGVPPEVFFALSFDGTMPTGQVHFHDAFLADSPVE